MMFGRHNGIISCSLIGCKPFVVFWLLSVLGSPVFAQITAAPNPFNEKTIVSYSISEADTVSITVADVSGKIVSKFLSGVVLQPAIYSDTLFLKGQPDGVYYLMLKTTNRAEVVKLIKTVNVSISEKEDGQILNVFPNPSAHGEKVHVQTERVNSGDVTITITDSQGKEINRISGPQDPSFEIDDLDAGLYILQVEAGSRTQTFRIIKY